MRIFLCWSGPASLSIATAMKEFLGDVIQELQPFLSSESIRKGDNWRSEIAQALAETNYGILCLTKDNLQAPWILFEAGALSKNLDRAKGKVTALLGGIQATDVVSPLSQFQHTSAEHNDVLKLLQDINDLLPSEKRLDARRLERYFEQFWPDFEAKVTAALNQQVPEKAAASKHRSSDDMAAEILVLVRELKRSSDQQRRVSAISTLSRGLGAGTLKFPLDAGTGLLGNIGPDTTIGDVFQRGLLSEMQRGFGDEQLPSAADPTIGEVVKPFPMK